MSEAAEVAGPPRPACQPFTFGGLTAFADGRPGRLLFAELLTALFVAGCLVAFLQHAYAPVILEAIQEMPEGARITHGRLSGVGTTIIAEAKLLAIAITPEAGEAIGQSADVQVQFRPANFRVGTVFRPDWGWQSDYSPGTEINLGRSALEPWWGAWRPILLTGIGLLAFASLFAIWGVVGLVYCAPAKLLAWFSNRALTWLGAWRLCSASLLPGTILLGFGLLLYARQWIDLVTLAFLYATHFVVGWVYVVGGTLTCPKIGISPPHYNPFNQ
jgi:hypothetical protein